MFTKYYQDVFPVDIRAEEALFIWKAGEAVQEATRKEMLKNTEQGDRRGLLVLKRGGRIFALGVFSQLAELRNGPDYLRTIDQQRVISKGADDRIGKYAKLATLWYKRAVETLMDRTGQDLSVLVRDQGFFENVKKEIDFLYRTMTLDDRWARGALPKLF